MRSAAPTWRVATATGIDELIVIARDRFEATIGGPGVSFDSLTWDIAHLRDRTVTSTNRRIYFMRFGSTTEPLPAAFAGVVKSWLILERRSAKDMATRLDALRILWEAILSRRKAPAAFRWESLCYEDLSEAESAMRTHWRDNTTHKRTISMLGFIRFLAARGICKEIYYRPQTPRIEDLNRHTIAGQQARRDHLPTDAALEGLADVYRLRASEPSEPADHLRICAVALLTVTGFRIGELLTLPLDCEVEEEHSGRLRYGLRYYREKSRGGLKMLAVRWLTPIGAELARQSISEIRALTADARERAQSLERSPTRVAIPEVHWATRLDLPQVAQLLGSVDVPKTIARRRDGKGVFCRAFDVEAYLMRLRPERLWTVDLRNGSFQMLSQSLFVVFRNYFRHAVCKLLVQIVNIQNISDFLCTRAESRSVFERFDIREKNGTLCRVTSHQFRHWLNYIADKGGLPVDLQTRWMGRDNPRDTEAYRHATVDERIEWVKQGIREGSMGGAKAGAYFDLPRARRDQFLETEIQAVHMTAFGLCLHDFAVTPCPYHLNCVRGCPDYLRTKGNHAEREHLVRIRTVTEQALASAQSKGREVADAWIHHCEETLEGIATALSVDDAEPLHDGSLVRPFSQRKRTQ